MDRLLFSFLFFGLLLSLPAQSVLQMDSIHGRFLEMDNALILEGTYTVESNSVRNDLMFGLIQAETIDRQTRQKSLDNINKTGVGGQSIEADLILIMRDSLFSRRNWRTRFQFAHRSYTGTQFDEELFSMTFFGNKQFEGQTVDLAPSAGEQQVYQKVGLGIHDDSTNSWLTLSFVKGQRYQFVDLERAEVFTEIDGRSIDAQINGSYILNDTASDNSFSEFNGAGVAIDASFTGSLKSIGSGDVKYNFQLRDMGIVSWNNNTLVAEKDSTYEFEGIEIENIFDIDNLVLGEDAVLDTLGIRFSKKARTRLLPFTVRIECYDRISGKTSLHGFVHYTHLKGYRPLFGAKAYHKLGPWSRIGISGMYGGGSRICDSEWNSSR